MQKKHKTPVSYTPLLQPFVRDTRLAEVSHSQCDLEESIAELSMVNFQFMRESSYRLLSASRNFQKGWVHKVNKRLAQMEMKSF